MVPALKHFLPFMLKVADKLKGWKVQIEFYGLPKPFTGEPRPRPTTSAACHRGGPGRRPGGGAHRKRRLERPQEALNRILNARVGG